MFIYINMWYQYIYNIYTYIYSHNKGNVSFLSNIQTQSFKIDLPPNGPKYRRQTVNPRPQHHKTRRLVWSTLREYHSWDVNTIERSSVAKNSFRFSRKQVLQGQKYPWGCVITDILVWYRHSASIISKLWYNQCGNNYQLILFQFMVQFTIRVFLAFLNCSNRYGNITKHNQLRILMQGDPYLGATRKNFGDHISPRHFFVFINSLALKICNTYFGVLMGTGRCSTLFYADGG